MNSTALSNFPLRYALLTVLSVSLPKGADAATILQPAGASTTMGQFSPVGAAIDQSGLSTTYTSLSTDFDTYIASQPTANHGLGTNVWGATLGVRSGSFTLSLGGSYLVNGFALWNIGVGDVSSIRQFNITFSTDALFTAATTLSGFTASNSLGSGNNIGAQVFSFAPTTASFIRLDILNTYSPSSPSAGFNEVAIRVVPEPGTAMLSTLGVAAFVVAGRSRFRKDPTRRCSEPLRSHRALGRQLNQ